MRIFTADQVNQGSPAWWDLRRGIPTGSDFHRILTPVKVEYAKAAPGYLAELASHVAFDDGLWARWMTESMNKPPNKAIDDGQAREAESRSYLSCHRDVTIQEVGFILADNGMYGCSPDGLLISDTGLLAGTLECKNPTSKVQIKRVMENRLPREYKVQCHGHILCTGLPVCTFLSYCPPIPELLIDVRADDFTLSLKIALDRFTEDYVGVLKRLGLWQRFQDQRASTLSHYDDADSGSPPLPVR